MTTQQQTRDAWERLAAGYDEFVTPLSIQLADETLKRVGVVRGTRFLDVAAGTGALSIPAARLGAEVVAVDISSGMIAALEARARAEGLTVDGRAMDGHALDLPDNTFDVVASLNGVSLFPDLPQGLRELYRVTKPAGRCLLMGFGAPQKAEFFGVFLGAMTAVVSGFTGPPMDPPPLPFQVADPEVMRARLEDTGWKDVGVETVAWHMTFNSGTHFWNLITHSNPIGAMLTANLSDEQRAQVREVLDRMLRERSGGGPSATLTADLNVGIATK